MKGSVYLGIEGGGTKSTAVLLSADLRLISRHSFGPGNFRLLGAPGLRKLFQQIAPLQIDPEAIGIGLAGVRTDADREQVRAVAQSVWGDRPIVVTHDLAVALAAADASLQAPRVLVLSGTGSCCYGEDSSGKSAKVGGWGHQLGDLGSGYDIALRALKAAIYEYDRHASWGQLGRNILRALALNEPEDLISWIQSSDKAAVAQLAPVIFEAALAKDRCASSILADVARQLALDAETCAARLANPNEKTVFLLAGSVLLNQPDFAGKVGRLIKARRKAEIILSTAEGAVGAAKLALRASDRVGAPRARGHRPIVAVSHRYAPGFDPATSPTEMRHPASANLDRMTVRSMVELMLVAESEVVPALRREARGIERAIRLAYSSLQKGGRIFYVGAGTSGRLGVLDASECPPTFRVSPEMVQGIIAGGQRALWQAVEGAEDDWDAGKAALTARGVSSKDTVIGIAASGRTPFVWGALDQARHAGSHAILICFNPSLVIDQKYRPDLVIAPNLGPEILTGSTRLKSGTATKLILNMITTISMVRLGKVMSNLMIDLNPSNVKLRDRARRIVRELTKSQDDQALAALERNGWVVKRAVHDLVRTARKKKSY